MDNLKNKINWREEELRAYVLIFSMSANKENKTEEIKIINEMFNAKVLNQVTDEFNKDTFNESIQKISESAKRLNLSKNKIQLLFYDIKRIFDADGEFSERERNLTSSLKRAFNF